MGRRPRQASESGYYHVTTRGNQRRTIFREASDYATYCRLLREACQEHGVRIAHFCLMPNHTHLLLWAPELARLSQAMHWLQRRYWFYMRRQEALSGHFWQGPFHSLPIDRESYLLEAARYIERNPLQAGLTTDLAQYRWSSYGYYALGKPALLPLTPTPVYQALGGPTPAARRQAYREFVQLPQPSDRTHRAQPSTSVPGTAYLVPRAQDDGEPLLQHTGRLSR